MKKIKRCNKIILIFITLLTIISISNICNAAEITSDEYKITEIEKEKYIIGIYQNTRAETVKNNIKTESTIKIYNEEGQGITDETIVKTGNKIQIGNNTYIAIKSGGLKSTISAEEMLRMGIVNTFPSWPGSIIEYGEKRNFNLVDQHSDKRARTAIGQINDNNYVLINAKDRSEGVPMRAVGEMGLTLKCSMLFILDGGGSTQLWYRGRYIISSSDNRKRPDAIYFKTLE